MLDFVQVGFWTDERLEQCRLGWIAGKSASHIAQELGTTRNAILGQVHRRNWADLAPKKAGTNADKVREARAKREERRAAKLKPRINRAWFASPTETPPEIDPPTKVIHKSFSENGPKTLMDLEPGDCRFVLGDRDFLFCAAPALPEQAYCPVHARCVYQQK